LENGIEETQHNLAYLKYLVFNESFFMSVPKFTQHDQRNVMLIKAHQISAYFNSLSGVWFSKCYSGNDQNTWLPLLESTDGRDHFISGRHRISNSGLDRGISAEILQFLDIIIPDKDATIEQYILNETVRNALNQLYDHVSVTFKDTLEYNSYYTSVLEEAIQEMNNIHSLGLNEVTNPDHTSEREILKIIDDMIKAFSSTFYNGFMQGTLSVAEVARNLTYDRFKKMGM